MLQVAETDHVYTLPGTRTVGPHRTGRTVLPVVRLLSQISDGICHEPYGPQLTEEKVCSGYTTS
jgi:hypothetical protein